MASGDLTLILIHVPSSGCAGLCEPGVQWVPGQCEPGHSVVLRYVHQKASNKVRACCRYARKKCVLHLREGEGEKGAREGARERETKKKIISHFSQ